MKTDLNSHQPRTLAKILGLSLMMVSLPSFANSVTNFPKDNVSHLNFVTSAHSSLTSSSPFSVNYSANRLSTPPANYSSSKSLNLPNIDGQGISFADQYQNKQLGEWALQSLNGRAKMLTEPWIQETIKAMTWRLNAQARRQALLDVVIMDSPSINAFAAPGGVIGINSGTVLAASSMDELASVVAHEVAHISQRHYEHSMNEKKQAMLMQLGGMLAAIAASSIDGDAAAAVMMGSQTAAMNSTMAFSRSNEREADRVGMQIMNQAGFDARAMPKFFATMNQQSLLNQAEYRFLPSFVRSHPQSSERLSDAQSRAQQYPLLSLSQQKRHQALFDLLYWQVQLSSNKATQSLLTTAAKSSLGARLAQVSYLSQNQRFDEANKVLKALQSLPQAVQQSLEPLLSITQSRLLAEQNQWSKAATVLKGQQVLYPERRDLRLYLAKALTQSGQPEDAQLLLQPLIQQQPSDIAAWQGLQRASETLAKKAVTPDQKNIATINALRYRSMEELWRGRYDAALISLEQAKTQILQLSSPSSRAPLSAKVQSDIKQVKAAKDFKP